MAQKKSPNISVNTSLGGAGSGRNSGINTPKSKSMKVVGTAISATAKMKTSIVGSIANRMSVTGSGTTSPDDSNDDKNDDLDDSGDNINYRRMNDEKLEKAFKKMVKDLKLPPAAAGNMLKMPKPMKIQMLEANALKKKTVSFVFCFVLLAFCLCF